MTETPIRPLRGQDELRRLLHPASIAVVGASARAGAFGERVAANLGRFAGRVHLVNPRADLRPPGEGDGPGQLVALGAARLGTVRLIDNLEC